MIIRFSLPINFWRICQYNKDAFQAALTNYINNHLVNIIYFMKKKPITTSRFLSFILLALVCSCQTTEKKSLENAIYKNSEYSIDVRVDDLLGRMSLDEKIAQLNGGTQPVKKGELGVGTFGFMNMVLSPADAAKAYNQLQKAQIENTRLGIPATRSGEGLFAYMGNGSTSFPQPIALAASFDPATVSQMSEILAKEMKSRGIRRVLAPVVNLTRDPRWGRTNETYGEDPYLSGVMGAAYVKPMEEAQMSTMMKHFVANMGYDGQFTGPVHFDERILREKYFPAFKACADAGASSVMMAYNTLNGIPCATHKWLITDVLKNEWRFQGFVSTDGGSAQLIFDEQGIYKTPEELAIALMNAGCDKSSPPDFFQEPLKNAIKQGKVSKNRLNDAIRRILKQKFENGLFDNPYAIPEMAQELNNAPEHRAASLEIAKKTLVLLKNENNTLPFNKNVKNVAVVGPLGDWLMVGHYGGYGRHEVTVLEGVKKLLPKASVQFEKGVEMKYFAYPAIDEKYLEGKIKAEYFSNPRLEGNPEFIRQENKIEYDWGAKAPKGLPDDNFSVRWTGKFKSPVTGKVIIGATMDDGVKVWLNNQLIIDKWEGGSRRLTEAQVELEKNKIYEFKMEYYDGLFAAFAQLGWNVDIEKNIPKATEIAKNSDVIIAVMGMYENENWDRADLDLASEQEKLITELAKLNKPMVVVLQSGGVITMHDWIDKVDAVMVSWYPGCEGGKAIAQAIFGDYNPGGKLPLTFPKITGQVALNYNRLPKGKSKIKFIGEFNEPLFCFGHGLSYTTFAFKNLQISPKRISKTDSVDILVDVTNTGRILGEEVVQLYIHDVFASVAQPVKKLIGFKRVELNPNETKTVTFKITPENLKIWDINMKHVVEPGKFEIMVGNSSENIRLQDTLIVK